MKFSQLILICTLSLLSLPTFSNFFDESSDKTDDVQSKKKSNSVEFKTANKKINRIKNPLIGKFSIPGVYRPDLDYLQLDYQLDFTYGPIKKGSLLTTIVQEIRPDDTYAIQKISKFLLQYNPGAFIDGDINKLKVGAFLKYPAFNKPEFRKDSLSYLDNMVEESKNNLPSPLHPNKKKTVIKLKEHDESKHIEKALAVSNEKLKALELENVQLKKDKDEAKHFEMALAVSNDKLKALELEIEQLKKDKDEAKHFEKSLAVSNDKLNTLELENVRLKKEQDESKHLEKALAVSNDKLKAFELEIEQLKKDKDEAKHFEIALAVSNDKLKAFDLEVEQLKKDKDEAKHFEVALAVSNDKLKALELENAQLKKEQDGIKHFEKALAVSNDKFKALELENAQLKKEQDGIKHFEKALAVSNDKLKAVELENAQLKKEQDGIKHFEKALAVSNDRLKALELENVQLKKEQNESKRFENALAVSNNKLNTLKSESEQLEKEYIAVCMKLQDELAKNESQNINQSPIKDMKHSPANADKKTFGDSQQVDGTAYKNKWRFLLWIGLLIITFFIIYLVKIRITKNKISKSGSFLFDKESNIINTNNVTSNSYKQERVIPELSNSKQNKNHAIKEELSNSSVGFSQQSDDTKMDESSLDNDVQSMLSIEPHEDLDQISNLKNKFNEQIRTDITIEDQDIISQSEVYFTYGQHDMAEELLIDGIKANPEKDELKLKLFECYSKMDNKIKFKYYLNYISNENEQEQSFIQEIKRIYFNKWNEEI